MKTRNALGFILHIIDLVNVNIADVMDSKSNTIKKTVSKVASITPVKIIKTICKLLYSEVPKVVS